MHRNVVYTTEKGRNTMKDVTITIDHPGKLEILAEVLADSPAYAIGLKSLHAELEGATPEVKLSFDDTQGKMTCSVVYETTAHKAAVKAAEAVARIRSGESTPKKAKKAVKKKAKK